MPRHMYGAIAFQTLHSCTWGVYVKKEEGKELTCSITHSDFNIDILKFRGVKIQCLVQPLINTGAKRKQKFRPRSRSRSHLCPRPKEEEQSSTVFVWFSFSLFTEFSLDIPKNPEAVAWVYRQVTPALSPEFNSGATHKNATLGLGLYVQHTLPWRTKMFTH